MSEISPDAPPSPTAGAGEGEGAGMSHRQILLVFSGIMAGMLLAALDQTIVSTALPTIVGDLGGLEHLSWVVTAYLLTSTVSTPLYGKISDLYGRKIVFQAAIVIFVAGSLLCGLAQDMGQLIAFRGIQGIGAGGLVSMAFAIMGDVVSPRERGRYTGYLGAVFAVSSVAGPLLGGFIVDNLDWRWVFTVNVPVGIAAFLITSSVLHLPFTARRHRIDFEGAALFVAAVSALLLALVWGGEQYAWDSPTIVGLLLAAAVGTAVFVWWEGRVEEPILPMRLFRDPVFRVGTGTSLLIGMAMFGAIIFLPLFLQVATGASATSSGLLLLPLMGGLLITSILSGRVITRTGRYKAWPVAGSLLTAVAFLLLSTMGPDTTRVVSSAYMLLAGLGIGMVMQVQVLAVQNAVPFTDLGVATSAVTFFRSLGGSIGVAAFGAIFNARMATELALNLPEGAVDGSAGSIANSPEQIRSLPPDVASGVIESISAAVSTVFLWATPLVLAAFVVSLFLRELPLRTTAHVVSQGADEPDGDLVAAPAALH